MPELPDVAVYIEALEARIMGATLARVRLASPFLLRSVDPPITTATGRRVIGLRRLGKRIVIGLEGDLFLMLHLMIAGRLHWKAAGAKLAGKIGLAAFDFSSGTLVLTEAGSKRREALYTDAATFHAALTRENHTLKRALTDPGILSGIGNAYSDEILHRAKMSPVKQTRQLSPQESARLLEATRATLLDWCDRIRTEAAGEFPEGVTAFREGMAVHGRYGKPCPVCGSPVQRIAYADNETNYCPTCQTGGRLLADRALSRLLKQDWPRTLEELEDRIQAGRRGVSARSTSASEGVGPSL